MQEVLAAFIAPNFVTFPQSCSMPKGGGKRAKREPVKTVDDEEAEAALVEFPINAVRGHGSGNTQVIGIVEPPQTTRTPDVSPSPVTFTW